MLQIVTLCGDYQIAYHFINNSTKGAT